MKKIRISTKLAYSCCLTLSLSVVSNAHAQTPAPVAEVPAARDAEAASRATREAVNPMRVIIEAGKLKTRVKADGDSADAKPAARAAVKPAAAPVAAVARPSPPTTDAKAGAPAKSLLQPQAQPAATSTALSSPGTQPAVEAPPAELTAKVSEKPLNSPPPAAALAPPIVLKLAQMVEPSMPESVRRRLRADAEVVVDFKVNTDGSVSDIAVRSSPLKGLETAVIDAIKQWRYEPIREARAHAVQLVFRMNE